MYDKEIFELFGVGLSEKGLNSPYLDHCQSGFITNFVPNESQVGAYREKCSPIQALTLFSVQERQNCSAQELMSKQILHYVEVYGLKSPGLFNLEFKNDKIVTMTYIVGISVKELGNKIRDLLYSNAPIKDTISLKNIVEHYKVDFDHSKILNNEMRVALFDENKHTFTDGDDVVRYMCFSATGEFMLIKSPEVISAVSSTKYKAKFLSRHQNQLARVFNRHKRILLAAKNKNNASIINKISRLSKKSHVPLVESISKTFVNKALSGDIDDLQLALSNVSIRDKFKYLNLLEYKKKGNDVDAFIIRNGKVKTVSGRKIYQKNKIKNVIKAVVDSLKLDLDHLKDQKILLDSRVDYGLPISRKQTMGKLPFGSTLSMESDISSGIHWRDEWGASDLDLSTVDLSGNRTGWGQYSGYNSNKVVYSGDVVGARNGAMEFMTSSKDYEDIYGLFVNIFSGSEGCSAEIVVGSKSDDKWMESPVIREKVTLQSRGSLIGFVRKGKFIAYSGRMNNSSVSSGSVSEAIINRATGKLWTVKKLLKKLDIDFDEVESTDYDHNLSYNQFSFDKLEKLLLSK